jgi:hypothetical protein
MVAKLNLEFRFDDDIVQVKFRRNVSQLANRKLVSHESILEEMFVQNTAALFEADAFKLVGSDNESIAKVCVKKLD